METERRRDRKIHIYASQPSQPSLLTYIDTHKEKGGGVAFTPGIGVIGVTLVLLLLFSDRLLSSSYLLSLKA